MNIRKIFPSQVLNGLILTSCFMFPSYVVGPATSGKGLFGDRLITKNHSRLY